MTKISVLTWNDNHSIRRDIEPSRQLRSADIFGEVRIYPADLAIAPFVLMLFFVGGDEAEILRRAQNDRARCPIGSGLKGKGEKL